MKKVLSALLLLVAIVACAGCAQKIIPVDTSYAPEVQSGLPNGTVVMVRTVAGTFFDKPAETVLFANKLFTHAWGREYAGIHTDILIVQPGLSVLSKTADQNAVLAAAHSYLKETIGADMRIICSD